MAFCDQALDKPNPLIDKECILEPEVIRSGRWMATVAGPQRNAYRMNEALRIQARGEDLWHAGAVGAWLAYEDIHTRKVLDGLNGPLFNELLQEIGYSDMDVVPMLLGAPILGHLTTSGRGVPKDAKELESLDDLWSRRDSINKTILGELRESDLDTEVMRLTQEEAVLGRVAEPQKVINGQVKDLVCHRFGVQQGDKPRCIDNGTSNGANPCTGTSERIREHRLNYWYAIVAMLVTFGFLDLTTCKVDVNAAFRRVPILPAHRWAAGFVFWFMGAAWTSTHYAAPFGFKGSVYAWERVSNALWAICTQILLLPLAKYVDDYYAVETQECIGDALLW